MKIKNNTLCVLMVMAFIAFVSAVVPAFAADLSPLPPTDSLALFEFLSVLAGSEQAAQWLTAIGFVCYLLTQILPWLPVAWLAKLPTWLMRFISYLAGNYRGTKNENTGTTKRTP